jgi:DNA-binding protein HU-beta
MNKTELIAAVAKKADMTKTQAEAAVNATLNSIVDAMAAGEKVALVGFGTFEVADVKERTGTIQMGDRKGETYVTPAHKAPKFKAGAAMKNAVNK